MSSNERKKRAQWINSDNNNLPWQYQNNWNLPLNGNENIVPLYDVLNVNNYVANLNQRGNVDTQVNNAAQVVSGQYEQTINPNSGWLYSASNEGQVRLPVNNINGPIWQRPNLSGDLNNVQNQGEIRPSIGSEQIAAINRQSLRNINQELINSLGNKELRGQNEVGNNADRTIENGNIRNSEVLNRNILSNKAQLSQLDQLANKNNLNSLTRQRTPLLIRVPEQSQNSNDVLRRNELNSSQSANVLKRGRSQLPRVSQNAQQLGINQNGGAQEPCNDDGRPININSNQLRRPVGINEPQTEDITSLRQQVEQQTNANMDDSNQKSPDTYSYSELTGKILNVIQSNPAMISDLGTLMGELSNSQNSGNPQVRQLKQLLQEFGKLRGNVRISEQAQQKTLLSDLIDIMNSYGITLNPNNSRIPISIQGFNAWGY